MSKFYQTRHIFGFSILVVILTAVGCDNCPPRIELFEPHFLLPEVKELIGFRDLDNVSFRNEFGEIKTFSVEVEIDGFIEIDISSVSCEDRVEQSMGYITAETYRQVWSSVEGDTVILTFTSNVVPFPTSVEETMNGFTRIRNGFEYSTKFVGCDSSEGLRVLEIDDGQSDLAPFQFPFRAYGMVYRDLWGVNSGTFGTDARFSKSRGAVTIENCSGRWAQIL